MVDNIVLFQKTQILKWSIEMPIKISHNGLEFRAKLDDKGIIRSYRTKDHLGLLHIIFPEEYQIRNSVHKAFNILQGSFGNHNDFYFEDLYKVIYHISNLYNLKLEETFIRKIELGVNVEVNETPMNYIKNLNSAQYTKLPDSMRHSSKAYGKKIFLSQYSFKLYDKTFHSNNLYRDLISKGKFQKLVNNIVRFELVFTRIDPIKRIVSTLKDLVEPNNYAALTNLLLKKFKSLEFKDEMSFKNLTVRELDLLYAGLNPKYWEHLKEFNKHTRATKKQKFKNIQNKKICFKNSNVFELKSKCEAKIIHQVSRNTDMLYSGKTNLK